MITIVKELRWNKIAIDKENIFHLQRIGVVREK